MAIFINAVIDTEQKLDSLGIYTIHTIKHCDMPYKKRHVMFRRIKASREILRK